MRSILTALGSSVLILGTAHGYSAEEEHLPIVRAQVEIQSSASGTIRHAPVKPVGVAWGIVDGGLTGRTRNMFYSTVVDGHTSSFIVDLKVAEEVIGASATLATEDSLAIQPSDTRIARVATVGYLPGHPNVIFGGEVHAAKSDRILMGFYVDRPCHLSGRMSVDGTPSGPRKRYELDVPEAGLTWVEAEVAGDRIVMKLVPLPQDIVYLIFDDR